MLARAGAALFSCVAHVLHERYTGPELPCTVLLSLVQNATARGLDVSFVVHGTVNDWLNVLLGLQDAVTEASLLYFAPSSATGSAAV